jgi:hypothetical protein
MQQQNQLSVFIACMAIGFLGGILYEPFSFVRRLFRCDTKRKKLGIAVDTLFFTVFALLSVCLNYLLNFNDFRIFWWIGYILGGIIYLKSLHKIIAFFENVCYNKVTKLVKKAKNQEKALKKRRIKQV